MKREMPTSKMTRPTMTTKIFLAAAGFVLAAVFADAGGGGCGEMRLVFGLSRVDCRV